MSNARPATAATITLTSLLATGAASAADRIDGPLRESGFVGYIQQQALDYAPFERWPGVEAKRLSADAETGRLSIYARFPAGWTGEALPAADQSIDLVMLEGELGFGDTTLGRWDFAFVPPGVAPPTLASDHGAEALVFFDPAVEDAAAVERQRERGSFVTAYDPKRWAPASLAKSAGALADLEVMHLKRDPDTTARTWYVRLKGGMTVPWEIHSMPEEGYVMEGDYVLAECLSGRTVIGDYAEGGYFWRPGGIPHSGPDSGPKKGVVWLQRSPIALDVVFYHRCEGGVASEPVRVAGGGG